MGTPDFAVASLKALYESGEHELAVVTQPDKPKGRGYALTPPEVKVYAEQVGLPVYQPETLRDEAFQMLLAELDPAMIVVAAYGKILPKSVLDYPPYGCINVHGSLLPKYRGAAPIQRALIEGETETGVTIMYMAEGLDTGDMLYKTVVPITADDTFETLFDKMAAAGAEALMTAIPKIVDGTIRPEAQDDSLSTYAAKIEKGDCRLDFSASAAAVHNRIRGLSPFPLASTVRGNTVLKLVKSRLTDRASAKPCGSLLAEGGSLFVVCGDRLCVEILELLPAGKKRMSAADYLRGNRLNGDEILG
ncbi:MAG: methionyl-tRNA formyltransferase [Ruminococcaceae bacterium]|nr:methionyl-tRNA formyltransferase [Oscillospiraceae bacterium]